MDPTPLEAVPIVTSPPFRSSPAAPLRRLARFGVGLVLVGVVSATATLAAPDAAPPTPDTLAATVHTATADGSVIDAAAYPASEDVYLVARTCPREEAPLPAGDYVFAVFDADGALRSADALAQRRFTVDAFGRISGTSGDHATVRTICPDNGSAFITIALAPLAPERAPSDVLWLRVATAASATACVRTGDPTGFGCDSVERTSVAFAIDPAASPTPSAPPSGTPDASGSPGSTEGSASPAPAGSGSPVPSDGASPSTPPADPGSPSPSVPPAGGDPSSVPAEPSPTGSSEPGTSGGPSAPPSPGTGASSEPSPQPTPTPAAAATPTPAAAATPTPRPSPSPPPAGGGSVPGPTPAPQGPAPGTGGSWTPPALPSYVPYSIPPGYYVCPGQLITPTGCQPIDGGGTGTGATPMPSWTWGPAPSGAPVFPGIISPPGGADPGASSGGLPGNPGNPGDPSGGHVEAVVFIFGPFPPPGGVPGGPGTDTPWASDGIGASPGTASPRATIGPSASAGTSGAVAAATGLSQDGTSRPPQPVPAGSVTAPTPPTLPIVLAVVLLVLAGASIAAVIGWARRGFVRPTRAILGGGRSPFHGMVQRIRRVGRGIGHDAGVQP